MITFSFPSNGQSIKGRIIDANDGKPLAGAIVRTTADDGSTIQYSMSDSEGIFTIIAGADAIVCGALTSDGDIDVEAIQNMLGMVRCGGGKSFTFHRAFDVCRDPIHALSVLKELGVTRILTSGQQSTAEKGIPLLKQLVEEAGDRLIILPGGGVNSGNAREILQQTGAKEIHGSCRKGTTSTDAAEVAVVIREINH